jgi:hypothetical protein
MRKIKGIFSHTTGNKEPNAHGYQSLKYWSAKKVVVKIIFYDFAAKCTIL